MKAHNRIARNCVLTSVLCISATVTIILHYYPQVFPVYFPTGSVSIYGNYLAILLLSYFLIFEFIETTKEHDPGVVFLLPFLLSLAAWLATLISQTNEDMLRHVACGFGFGTGWLLGKSFTNLTS